MNNGSKEFWKRFVASVMIPLLIVIAGGLIAWGRLQTRQDQTFSEKFVTKTELDNIEKRLDRIESKLDSLMEQMNKRK